MKRHQEGAMNMFDVIIIGGGPAGLSAGLYASRALLKTAVIEKGLTGGLITTTTEVDNYPGSEKNATGESITFRMFEQCQEAGCEFVYDDIISVKKQDNIFILDSISGKSYQTKSVILCSGTNPKLLGAKGEIEFRGRGVSYCATCDAGFFKNMHVAIVGGGDTAIKEADYLTKFASKVTVIHRREEFRATKILLDELKKNPKIVFELNQTILEIQGDTKVRNLLLKNVITDEIKSLAVDGLFIFAGYEPNLPVLSEEITLDENGFIVTDENMYTSLPGLFAAGDIRSKRLKQVITAAADGAIAAVEAEHYNKTLNR